MKTRNLAVMLTDIKGFTDRISKQSRSQMSDLLKAHRDLVMPVIEKYNGKIIKTIGDAFLVTFESPTDAVLCGVAVQDTLREYNEGKKQDERIDVRIAINAGEVSIADDGDIFGDAVNITSRIESIAEAGEVFFTEAVYLAMNKKEVPSSEIGLRQFKGVPEKIKVYKVLKEDPVGQEIPLSPDYTPPDETPAGSKRQAPTPPAGDAGVKDENIFDISGDGIHIKKNGKEIKIGKTGIEITKDGKKIRIDNKHAMAGFPQFFGGAGSTAESTRDGAENEVPAGFFRRFWALLLDFLIFSIIAGILIGGGPRFGYRKTGSPLDFKAEPGVSHVRTNTVRIGADGVRISRGTSKITVSRDGIDIRGGDGKKITVGRGGIDIRSEMPAQRVETHVAEEEEEVIEEEVIVVEEEGPGTRITIDVGDAGEERPKRKRFPLKMILWVLYGTVFLRKWGATPGKMILQLKVVDVAGRAALKTRQAFLRSLFSIISAIPLCLGYLWAAWEGNTKTWHDIIAGTKVIRKAQAER